VVGQVLPDSNQVSNGVERTVLHDLPTQGGLFDGRTRTATRFSGQRLYFGIGVTAAIDRLTSFFFQLEGLPFADQLSYKARSRSWTPTTAR
jgi:hypothetical protein